MRSSHVARSIVSSSLIRGGFALLPLVACGPVAPVARPVVAPTVASAPKPPAPVSPARWSLHPTRAAKMRVRLELPGAMGVLYAGDGGERWLEGPDGAAPHVAADLLAETITAATVSADGAHYAFAGQSGTIYTTSGALSAVTATHPAERPLRSVVAGQASFLAIDERGAMVRSLDAGVSWSPVALAGANGTLVQLAMAPSGQGLALVAPQHLFATVDDGASFVSVASPGVGARRVIADADGEVTVEGLEASGVLRTTPPRIERVSHAPAAVGLELTQPPDGPVIGFATAVARSMGALIGDRYAEVVTETDDPSRWRLGVAPLGDALVPKKMSELTGCDRVFVGGDAHVLYLLCDSAGRARPGSPEGAGPMIDDVPRATPTVAPDSPELRILRSEDGGKSFKADGSAGTMQSDDVRLWVAPDGALILSGACKRAKAGCTASAPIVRLPGAHTFAKVGVPHDVASIAAMAFAPNGSHAYALTKLGSGALALLASSDQGRDFTRVALGAVTTTDPKERPLGPQRLEPGSIAVDDAGAVHVSAHTQQDWVIYASSDEGVTVKSQRLPFRADAVELVGAHGFAYRRDGHGWESVDGGNTWVEVAAPPSPESDRKVGWLACDAYGCLVGDRATRIGWNNAPATKPVDDAAHAPPPVGATYACTVSGTWTTLTGVESPPTAYEADPVDGARWMSIARDAAKGDVAVLIGGVDGKGVTVKRVPLLPAAPKDTATAVLPQLEGVAALRYTFKVEKPAAPAKGAPKAPPIDPTATVTTPPPVPPPSPIVEGVRVDVEVVWYVAATGKVHRATIRGAGPIDAKDVVLAIKDHPADANVGLLSIATGGIHVRPFATRAEAPLYFISDAGNVERMEWPELPTHDARGAQLDLHFDAVRVDGKSVLIGVDAAGVEVFTAWSSRTDPASPWETRVWGLWPDLASTSLSPWTGAASWEFAYLGGRPALVTTWPGGDGIAPTAFAESLTSASVDPPPPVAVPTQRDLSATPRACDAASLRAPRLVAPYQLGTRHPVIISGDGNDLVLATEAALLHGTDGKSACVMTYEAGGTTSNEGPIRQALISADTTMPSLLFSDVGRTGEVSVTPMKCEVSMRPLPKALADVDGFAPPPVP